MSLRSLSKVLFRQRAARSTKVNQSLMDPSCASEPDNPSPPARRAQSADCSQRKRSGVVAVAWCVLLPPPSARVAGCCPPRHHPPMTATELKAVFERAPLLACSRFFIFFFQKKNAKEGFDLSRYPRKIFRKLENPVS